MSSTDHGQTPEDGLSSSVAKMRISDDPRAKLKSWLGKILKIVITDGRVIVGCFVCTDRDGNVILENSWEYSQSAFDGKSTINYRLCILFKSFFINSGLIRMPSFYHSLHTDNNEPRILGLALIPGKHMLTVELMTH